MEGRDEHRDFWMGHAKACLESGQSQLSYCTRHGLKPTTLSYWIRRDREQTTKLNLVPVKLVSAPNLTGLVLRGHRNWQLDLPMNVSPDWLVTVLRGLE